MKNCEQMCCFNDSRAMAAELIRLQKRVSELERMNEVPENMKKRINKGRLSIFAQELLTDTSPDKVARFLETSYRTGSKSDIWKKRHKVNYYHIEEALKKMADAIFEEVSNINSVSDFGAMAERIEKAERPEALLSLYFDIYRQVCRDFSATVQLFHRD